jgi:outer membrane protein
MKIICLILFMLASFNAIASFQNLLNDFSISNNDLEILKLDNDFSKLDRADFDGQYDWSLSFELGKDDTYPAGFFDFQSQKTSATHASFGLNKSFSWGGDLSFMNTFIDYDLSEWTTTAPFETGAEVKNVITYNQNLSKDFFGSSTRLQDELSQSKYELSESMNKLSVQQNYFSFLNNYLNSKLQKTVLMLNRKALARQEKRYKGIVKKYRDGLSQKIDKLQSQIALQNQKTNLKQIRSRFLGELNKLESSLNRQVTESEINEYNFDSVRVSAKVIGDEKTSLVYLSHLKQEEVASLGEQVAGLSKRPDVNFSASYTINAINSEASDAFNDAAPGGDNRNLSLALNIIIPLGNTLMRNQLAKARIQKMKVRSIRKASIKNTKLMLNLLSQRIVLLKEKLDLELQKVKMAKLALRENNRLYNLGKTEIEPVLSSEESLINSELSFASSLYEYDLLVARDALTKGKVIELLKSYEVSHE